MADKTPYQMLPIGKLELNMGQVEGLPKNPRYIKDEEYEKLKRSIQASPEFLEARMLLVYPIDGGKYVVIAGNMRLRACRDLGFKELPCYVFKKETPVEKLREYTIKDNANFGAWDYDLLANESWSDDLEQLSEWGVDISFMGLDEEESGLDDMDAAKNAVDDDFDEDQEEIETICKLGDIWQLGRHRLMCGDSTKQEDVALLMGGSLADLLLTDPPYNVAYGYDENDERFDHRKEEARKIMNDSMEDDEFRQFLRGAFACAKENMKEGAAYYIFHADSESYNFRGALRDVGDMQLRQTLIWVKDSFTMGRQDYQWRHEPCLYGWKEGAGHFWNSDRKQGTCLEFARPKVSLEHPTMKPVPLFAYLVANSTKKDDLVLDLFGGSGTTMIACEQLNRCSFLMELDPHYCDVIITRWQKFTGLKAEKIN